MAIGNGSNLGPIGGNPFAMFGVDLDVLLALHGVDVTVTRHNTTGTSDIYAEPQDDPDRFTARLLMAKPDDLKEIETLAGGKRNEIVIFLGQPGTLLENDIVAYGGHDYDVRQVDRTVANSAIVSESYVAVREVDM